MEVLLYIGFAAIVGYALIKLGMYIYRPFGVQKFYEKIDNLYKIVSIKAEKDIKEEFDLLDQWRSEDEDCKYSAALRSYTEEEILKRIENVKNNKEHELQVHDKFLRCIERFGMNFNKPTEMAEYMTAYYRYLTASRDYFYQIRMGSTLYPYWSLEEMKERDAVMYEMRKKYKIIIEQCEIKLDRLLLL